MHIQFWIDVFVILIKFVERACILKKKHPSAKPHAAATAYRVPIKIGLSILGAPNFHKATTIAFCHIVQSNAHNYYYIIIHYGWKYYNINGNLITRFIIFRIPTAIIYVFGLKSG